MQSQVETLRHSLRTTETKAAVLEVQQQEAQKQIQRLEKEIQEFKSR